MIPPYPTHEIYVDGLRIDTDALQAIWWRDRALEAMEFLTGMDTGICMTGEHAKAEYHQRHEPCPKQARLDALRAAIEGAVK